MIGKYLLDTNIIIALINQEPAVIQRISESSETAISSITVGELCYGARQSKKTIENLAKLDSFFAEILILDCTEVTGKIYGAIKSQLRKKGRPIPENDIWIAATALQYDLILVTRDSDFEAVDNLILESW